MDELARTQSAIWQNVHRIALSAIPYFDQDNQNEMKDCIINPTICVGKHSCASNFLQPWFDQVKSMPNILTMDFLQMLRFQHRSYNVCVIDYSNYVMSMKNNRIYEKIFDVISNTRNITYVLVGFQSYFNDLQSEADARYISLQNVRFLVVSRRQNMFCQADDAAVIITSLLGGFLMFTRDKYNHRCNYFDVWCMLTNTSFMTPIVNLVAELVVKYSTHVPQFSMTHTSSDNKYTYCSCCITPKNFRDPQKTSTNLFFQRSINTTDNLLLRYDSNINSYNIIPSRECSPQSYKPMREQGQGRQGQRQGRQGQRQGRQGQRQGRQGQGHRQGRQGQRHRQGQGQIQGQNQCEGQLLDTSDELSDVSNNSEWITVHPRNHKEKLNTSTRKNIMII
jgi:hypothetical protein